jgi:putative endonuclease
MKQYYVYILSSKRNGTLYIGVTSDLRKRIYEHKNNLVEGFTKTYNVHLLVWYEVHEAAESAIRNGMTCMRVLVNKELDTGFHRYD